MPCHPAARPTHNLAAVGRNLCGGTIHSSETPHHPGPSRAVLSFSPVRRTNLGSGKLCCVSPTPLVRMQSDVLRDCLKPKLSIVNRMTCTIMNRSVQEANRASLYLDSSTRKSLISTAEGHLLKPHTQVGSWIAGVCAGSAWWWL